MNTYGLTKAEYVSLLKECGMCTKKWTRSKLKHFHERRLEIIYARNAKKKSLFGKKEK